MMSQELPVKLGCASCGVTSDLYGSSCRHMTLCRPCGKRMVENATPCLDCGAALTRLICDGKLAQESTAMGSSNTKGAGLPAMANGTPSKAKSSSQVTEEDIKGVLKQAGPIKSHDLVNKFKNCLATNVDKQAFAAVLKNISRIHKTDAGIFIVLRDNYLVRDGLDESGDDESSDDDNELDNEDNSSPVLAPKRKGPKEEPMESTPAKAANAAPGRTTPASAATSKGKRKAGTIESKPSVATSSKKVKTESSQEGGKLAKESTAMGSSNTKGAGSLAMANGIPPKAKSCSQVTEEDVKAVLKQAGPIKTYDLVKKFKNCLATNKDKQAFAAVLKNISRIHKTDSGIFIMLRENYLVRDGLDESGDDESSDDDNDLDNKDNSSPVLAPKRKEGPKKEPMECTPAKAANAAPGRTTPASAAASRGEWKAGTNESKPSVATSSKKVKTDSSEEDDKLAKESTAMGSSNTKGAGSLAMANGTAPKAKSSSQVTEEDVKAVLKQAGPIKSHDLVNKFKNCLATNEDKQAFAAVLKNISRIHKTDAGIFIVLRENYLVRDGLDESGDDKFSDDDNEDNSSPVFAPKHKGPKEEPMVFTPAKAANAAPGRTTPASAAASKGKRKAGTDESKPSVATTSKKVKTESSQEYGKQAKESTAMGSSNTKGAGSPAMANGTPPKAKSSSQITEEDVKAVLKQAGPIKSHDLVNKFRNCLATNQDKQAFVAALKNISRIHKTDAGNFIVLREK